MALGFFNFAVYPLLHKVILSFIPCSAFNIHQYGHNKKDYIDAYNAGPITITGSKAVLPDSIKSWPDIMIGRPMLYSQK
ncbi:hypothetical protein D0466_18600 [Peribacillus glennii]|uniref:Uncharacterized protein n=1 Tax=Peribacillus glennii TaxID=2303991 RepID=A0A372L8I7_9BACI|nr:hypothetical protein D0466_18600 [Peribacillus glennii]